MTDTRILEHQVREQLRVRESRIENAIEVLESAGLLTSEQSGEIRVLQSEHEDESARDAERQEQRKAVDKLLRRIERSDSMEELTAALVALRAFQREIFLERLGAVAFERIQAKLLAAYEAPQA